MRKLCSSLIAISCVMMSAPHADTAVGKTLCSAALLHAIGRADWVAHSVDDYVERATALAAPAANRAARAHLATPAELSIFAVDAFTDALLAAVRRRSA